MKVSPIANNLIGKSSEAYEAENPNRSAKQMEV